MSGVLKGLGKIFKKVVSVAKVVLPIALAAAAVVFTGGAALGILPTFAGAVGGLVGGLGLSAGVATALTGAVVGAGFGSAIGGLGAAATGKSIIGGMQAGALTGAVTGGLMPSSMPGMSNVIKSGALTGAQAATGAASAASTAASGIAPTAANGAALGSSGLNVLGGAPVSAIGAGAQSLPAFGASGLGAGAAGAASSLVGAASSGINPLLASQLLSGVSSAFAPNEAKQRAQAQEDAAQDMGFWAYGGGDSNGKKAGGIIPGVYSSNPNAFGQSTYGAPPQPSASSYYQPMGKRWNYNPTTNSVEEVPA